jgi:GNAT superfamily N-acetyltransferase
VLWLYVVPEEWDQGLGGTLLTKSLEELRRLGFREATLTVFDGNDRARRFYEERGWVSDGHRTHYPELGVADTRFRLALGGR